MMDGQKHHIQRQHKVELGKLGVKNGKQLKMIGLNYQLHQEKTKTELNFAWYSNKEETSPKVRISKNLDMSNFVEFTGKQSRAVTNQKTNVEYVSNKVTATDLKADTTYYYSYQKDGQWTAPEKYTTDNGSKFSFIFVGDPQIGSSNELKGAATEEFYNAQSAAVANDAFNWNTTLNQAMEKTGNKASFVLSSGDQIQSTKKKVSE